MKTKSYLIGLALLAAGLITFNSHKATAENPGREAATVILGYDITYEITGYETINGRVYPIYARNPNGTLKETGLHVIRVSTSGNAPEVSYGENLAVASAKLQNDGLIMQPPTGRPELFFVRTRR